MGVYIKNRVYSCHKNKKCGQKYTGCFFLACEHIYDISLYSTEAHFITFGISGYWKHCSNLPLNAKFQRVFHNNFYYGIFLFPRFSYYSSASFLVDESNSNSRVNRQSPFNLDLVPVYMGCHFIQEGKNLKLRRLASWIKWQPI